MPVLEPRSIQTTENPWLSGARNGSTTEFSSVLRVCPGSPGRRGSPYTGAGPVSEVDSVIRGGPYPFHSFWGLFHSPAFNRFLCQELVWCQYCSAQTTFLFSMSTDMKLFTSLSVRLWHRPNGPVLGTKVGFVLLCRVLRLSLFSPRAR